MKTEAILPYELALPARVIFEEGASKRLLAEAAAFGSRGVLAHSRSAEKSGALARILENKPHSLNVLCWRYRGGEPRLTDVEELRRVAFDFKANWLAGLGGGSVLDTAKAAAGLLTSDRPVVEYHDGTSLPQSAAPFLAVPTTAGTGSEATSVCVLTNPHTGVKKSFRHPSLFAKLVILDSLLLQTCPPSVLAASGMDALTQAIESFTSKYATWLSDQLASKAVELIASSLQPAYESPNTTHLKSLLTGSFLAGVALSHARLGVVHGLAHPLGARYGVPHGLACSVCLPHAIEFNRPAIGSKYETLCDLVGSDLLFFVEQLTLRLGIRSPFSGVPLRERDTIIEETLASGSTKANPRPVARDDVVWFLERIFNTDASQEQQTGR